MDRTAFGENGPLATGVPHLDRQHADLARQFEDLVEATSSDGAPEAVRRRFLALAEALDRHFADEEAHLAEEREDLLPAMSAEHAEFRVALLNLERHLETGRIPLFLDGLFVLEDRLFKHLTSLDLDAFGTGSGIG